MFMEYAGHTPDITLEAGSWRHIPPLKEGLLSSREDRDRNV